MQINRKSFASVRFAQKNKAKIFLLVRVEGIECEPMIIFKVVSDEKTDEREGLKK